jgi:PKD repeat protein
VFDPATSTFTDVENMAHGRWYPTVTTLGDGSVMSFSGLRETGGTNTTVEIYTMGSGWSPEYPAGWTPPLYPRMHLSTDGRVFYAGSGRGSRFFNPTTKTWTAVVATTNHGSTRSYGTSVLLPLWPADGYRPRVMILGGGNPATATTEIIDLSAATPAWQFGPAMSQPRIQMNATILPNGKVLAVGGSTNNEDEATKSLNADLFDPVTNTFSSAGANAFARLYHSGSLLLPDATVMLVGGNPTRGSYEEQIEIYSPAYLFNSNGLPAARPTITGVTPGAFGYGQTFLVQTPNAASIASVVLVRPGAQTHAIDMEQRLVGLNFTAGDGVLNVTAPPHGNIAPPGYYMLFVLDSAGVPSVASFVRIGGSISNQAPTAIINSPATNVTVNPGGAVSFSGTGTDPDGTISAYSWTFPGGTPSSASVATPGNVAYSTPGTYTASLSVTDNGGLVSSPATRTITVADFTLSATPSSRTVLPGASTTYTATATAGTGFTGTVAFSVTGLPAGATASFSPTSVTPSGTSTLTVATTTATPPGSYPLTIRGTSGPRVRTVNVTLVVNSGTFSITASPTSRTISRNAATTYTVTVPGGTGFVGTIALSVSGVPNHTTAKFSPTSIVNSGTSTLTVDTRRRVASGTYLLRISGTSGGIVRSVDVTLIVQ